MSSDQSTFCCIGESLWYALPEGLFLGGAPLNVAVDLHALGQSVVLLSAVGQDTLGELVRRRLEEKGLDTSYMQTSSYETGWVDVRLLDGIPSYTIHEPVAWDDLSIPSGGFPECEYLVHGSLALRSKTSSQTIKSAIESQHSNGGHVVFDVNLRAPFDQPETYKPYLYTCTILKINEDELSILEHVLDVDIQPTASMQQRLEAVSQTIECSQILCTQGAKGASVWKEGQYWHQKANSVQATDTVGAGDAFLAGFLAGQAMGLSMVDILQFSTTLAGFVATQPGATPSLSAYSEILRAKRSNPTDTF